jgi:DNA-binding winged helix-turn-helix (wHTH) protein/tetratricopeptide (TPR) repeat protein
VDAIDLVREKPFKLGRVVVDPSRRRVSSGELLEPRVMQVLVLLARANGAVVSRDELIERCWGGRIVTEDSITRVIGRLRKLAEDHLGDFAIKTVPKVGYRLEAIVQPIEPGHAPGPGAESRPPLSEPKRIALGKFGLSGPQVELPRAADSIALPAPATRKRRAARIGQRAGAVVAIAAALVGGTVALRQRAGEASGSRALQPVVTVERFAIADNAVPQSFADDLRQSMMTAPWRVPTVRYEAGSAEGAKGAVISGRISRGPNGVVVYPEIRLAGTAAPLWAEPITLPPTDLHASEIGGDIGYSAGCLVNAATNHQRPLSGAALKYWAGYCSNGDSLEGLDPIRRTLAAEPRFAEGWRWKAFVLMTTSRSAPSPAAQREAAEAVARAEALEPGHPATAIMRTYILPQGDFGARERELKKAIVPGEDYFQHQTYGHFLMSVGRLSEAREQYQLALGSQPGNFIDAIGVARAEAGRGNPEGAVELIDRTARGLDCGCGKLMDREASIILANAGDWAAAAERTARAPKNVVQTTVLAFLTARAKGDPTGAEAALDRMEALLSDPATRAVNTATIVALGGRDEAALRLVESAIGADRSAWSLGPLYSPAFARARQTSAFAALAERLGLMRYWRQGHPPDFCAAGDAPAFCAALGTRRPG